MENHTSITSSVALFAGKLLAQGKTLAVAESCTGGLLGHLITESPGASGFFLGSIVSYHNDVKRHLLGVSALTLEKNGAVSTETVKEMARGVMEALGSDFAVAISGIAGPAGGSVEKPVGLVIIGFAGKEKVNTFKFRFSGSRSEIKTQAAIKALEIIAQEIDT